jgi:hypothetical protein
MNPASHPNFPEILIPDEFSRFSTMLDVIYVFGANSYSQQQLVDVCFGQEIRNWYVMFEMVAESVGKFAQSYRELIGPDQSCDFYRVVDNDDFMESYIVPSHKLHEFLETEMVQCMILPLDSREWMIVNTDEYEYRASQILFENERAEWPKLG